MRLDWELLVRALDPGDDGLYGVDPVTGEIRFFGHHELEADDPEELWDEARYVMVDPVSSGVVGEWLEAFAESVGGAVGEDLAEAARGSDPVRAAREVLRNAPDLRRRWREFRRQRLQEFAREWATGQGLRPENPPPWRE